MPFAFLLRVSLCLWVASCSAGTTASPAVEATLARSGKTRWQIYVPLPATLVERFAAREFERYFAQITGAHLKPTTRSNGSLRVCIGLRQNLTPETAFLPPCKKGFDGYAIAVSADRIVIAGDSPRGMLYGVYDLLERLGCRWHVPTLDPRDPEVVPSHPDVRLPAGAWAEAARLELRIYNGSAFFFDLRAEQMLPQVDWAAKNRYNGISWQAHHKPGSVGEELCQMRNCGVLAALDQRGLFLHGPCHSFPYFLPTNKYFTAHLDWFGLYDGKRRPHGGEWPLVNYCWSNPEANAEFVRNVEDFLRDAPQLKILCIEWIDGGVVCACDRCRQRGAANLVIDLFNGLSERLATNFPAVRLESVVGYAPIEQPPTAAKPNGKWQALYAHWGRHHDTAYGDEGYPRWAELNQWRALFPRFEVCSYYAAASHQPFNGPPFLHAVRADTDFLVRQSMTGAYVLQYPHGFWWNYAFNLSAAGLYAY
jgi:hypothetical protein